MNSKLRKAFIIFGIPTIYAVVIRLIFGSEPWNEFFQVMSVVFLFILPVILGCLTVYLSDEEDAQKTAYRILAP